MDEFNDSDISSLLNQIAGSSPDTMMAQKVVLGKVRRVRQRRVVAVSAAAAVMVVSGVVAMVQNSQNRGGGSNIAVPLSPGDSEPIEMTTTVESLITTTTVDGAIPVNPIVTDPPVGTPSTQPSSNTTLPGNTNVATSTLPTNTEVPNNSQGPSITTAPPITPPPSTSPPTTVPDIKTWTCGGGSVKYRVTANGLVLVETTSAPGFTVSENKAKADEIVIKFIPSNRNDERQSVLKIKKSGLVSTSCEDEGFNRRSDTSNSSSTDNGSSDNNEESADD